MLTEKQLSAMTKLKLFILFCFWLNVGFSQPDINITNQDTMIMCVGDPKFSAEFPGGSQALLNYLQLNVINKLKLTQDEIVNLNRPVAKILITEKGKVDSVMIIRGSNINHLDSIYKASLIAMPTWKPAELNGKKIKQYFYIPLRIETK